MRQPPSLGPLRGFAALAVIAVIGCRTAQPPLDRERVSDSVAVGYGSQARRDVTGAVASVSGEVAQRTTPTTVADMIAGRFAGVEVTRLANGGVSVRIRGQRSFKSDGEPLYVVDGVPQHVGANGALTDISPRDIQSIEVLKDAGATAVYGARGANGVILITTKRPD